MKKDSSPKIVPPAAPSLASQLANHLAESSDVMTSTLTALGQQEGAERKQRLVVISLSAIMLVILVGGVLILSSLGLEPDKGLAGILITFATLALAYLIGRNVYKINRLSQIETILGETFYSAIAPQVIIDRAGQTLLANKSYDLWIGKNTEQAEAALIKKFGENATVAGEFQRIRKAARAGHAAQSELPIVKGGKITEWRRVIVRPLATSGYTVWRLEDVSARRRAEQAVREEQAKLIDFMAHAPVGIYSVDQTGRFLFANRTLADWLGCSIEELTSGNLKLHDVFAQKIDGLMPHAITGNGDGHLRGETFMRSKSGVVFPVAITQTVVMSEDSKTLRTRSIVRDLTPEQSWKEALNLSEKRFHRLFAESPIGVALLNPQMAIVECNDALVGLLRRDKKEILKSGFMDFVPNNQRADIQNKLRNVFDGAEFTQPLDVRGLGGADSAVFVNAKRFLLSGEGDERGLVLYFVDFTEQKRVEAQLAHSVKLQAIGQLAGGVAHDFNNLLTAMIGFCDLLLQRHKPGDQSFSDIMQIKQNGNRAANLVRQLLAFSRQQTMQPRVLNVTDVLAELANLLRRLIGANVEMKMTHGRDIGLIRADQGQLEQVIINLVVNARDAMPKGGAVTITTTHHQQKTPMHVVQDMMPAGDYVCLEVSDEGMGIPKENLERIFDPFFSTKEVGSGTGLGLSTVFGIIKQSGGYVNVHSTLNKGSRFFIYLPIHIEKEGAAEAPIENKEKKATDLTGVGTILLVEDEDAVRVFGARALGNKGYHVLEARSGEEALHILANENTKVDLLISDVVMPQMDGPTLIRQVKEKLPDLKVIFISGYTEDRFREQLQEGEVVHFLSKPFSLKQLAAKVKEVLTGEVDE